MTDLRITADAFIALMVMEAVVKPVAVRLGRWLIAQADQHVRWIPDWLHR